MISRSSGLCVTFFIFLYIQGIYGKSLLEQIIDDGGKTSITSMAPPSEDTFHKDPLSTTSDLAARRPEITGNSSEAIWYERMKKTPALMRTIRNSSHIARKSKRSLGGKWNDRMKNVLVFITGAIPPIGGVPVGKIFSSILNMFWPDSEKNIWSLIKDQVSGLIDQEILEYELQERGHEITAIQLTMQKYVDAKINEKGSQLTTLIHACDQLFIKLTQSKNSIHLIPLVVTHSTQHLLILKERLLHGKEMYSEDNTQIWRSDLENQISSYKDYIKDIYPKWVEWRKSKITLDVDSNQSIYSPVFSPNIFYPEYPYGKVHDEMTGERAEYKYIELLGNLNPKFFSHICEAVKEKMFGSRNAELLQILVSTFYLDNFMPGNEDNPSVVPPSMAIASFGPISPHIGGGDENFSFDTPGDDNTWGGDVTKIFVREWNIIDGFQVIYSTHIGELIGQWSGGHLNEIPLNNRRVKSIKFCENNCNQVEMTIGFSNGDSTGRLGNRDGQRVRCTNTGEIDTYGLYNIRANHNGCSRGLFQISVDYKAYPVRPSEIHK